MLQQTFKVFSKILKGAIALLLGVMPAQATEALTSDLSWMAGEWAQCTPKEIIEEHWLGPANNLMVGASLTRSREKATVFFEYLRIAQKDGKTILYASPLGREATPFTLTQADAQRIVFENSKNDFPKRIIYWREGENLLAKIDNGANDKSEGVSFHYEPKRQAKSCAK